MRLAKTTVTDKDGHTSPAIVAACDCGHDTFHVFQLQGQKHMHLECAECYTSHCPGGICDLPQAEEPCRKTKGS